MNMQYHHLLFVFCVFWSFLIANGSSMRADEKATLDEAKKAVVALQQKIQAQTNNAIPPVMEQVRRITNIRDEYYIEASNSEKKIVDETLAKVKQSEQNFIASGYFGVIKCMNDVFIEKQGDLIYADIKICASALALEAINTVSKSVATILSAPKSVEDISSTLDACGETQTCIDEVMVAVEKANQDLPKLIQTAFTEAKNALKLPLDSTPKNCIDNQLEELKQREEMIVLEISLCMAHVVVGSSSGTTAVVQPTQSAGVF